MAVTGSDTDERAPRRRVDADRNEKALLDAAAAEFATAGVDVPVRTVAARAGVGVGTVYRHFPTRAELVVAVYRHQVDACAEAGPRYLAEDATPFVALCRWVDGFVDFLVTKHGLAGTLGQSAQDEGLGALHAYFLDRLLPVCSELLAAAVRSGEIVRSDVGAYELMRSIGNLCIGSEGDDRYDARRMVAVFLAGLKAPR